MKKTFGNLFIILTIMMICGFFISFHSIANESFRANVYFDGNIVEDPGACSFDVEGLSPGAGDGLAGIVEDDTVIYNYNFGEVIFRSYNGRYVLDKKYRKTFNVEFMCTGELALESHLLVHIVPTFGTVSGQNKSVMQLRSYPNLKSIKSLGLQLLVNGNPVTAQRGHWLRVNQKTGMAFQLIQLDSSGEDLTDDATLFTIVSVIVEPN
ncbi:hypothetical protein [Pantoea ananatis]|uniref:hypothetical protein n=1 Tax=Pantoea ananas TaxID=553 RepID=UPI000366F0F3|nr:hypothetical protein [Pantoea ananatis]MDQ1224964.1 hypothetical protein [Pantoea ananatis]MDR6092370.1 hypothetical protein [Pantoea ananatis]PWV67002.1 hypothetical protein C7425_10328 [Pantoea ananatis]HCN00205.1 hypothetical protein [Pantoea ananatis]